MSQSSTMDEYKLGEKFFMKLRTLRPRFLCLSGQPQTTRIRANMSLGFGKLMKFSYVIKKSGAFELRLISAMWARFLHRLFTQRDNSGLVKYSSKFGHRIECMFWTVVEKSIKTLSANVLNCSFEQSSFCATFFFKNKHKKNFLKLMIIILKLKNGNFSGY